MVADAEGGYEDSGITYNSTGGFTMAPAAGDGGIAADADEDGLSRRLRSIESALEEGGPFADVADPEGGKGAGQDYAIDRTRPVQTIEGEAEVYGDPNGGFLSQLMSIGNVYDRPSELKVRLERDIEEGDSGAGADIDVDADALDTTYTYEDAKQDLENAYDEADVLRLRLTQNDTDRGVRTDVDTVEIELDEEFKEKYVDIYPEPLGPDTPDAHGYLESSKPQRAVLEMKNLTELLEEQDLRIDSGGRYEVQAEVLRREEDKKNLFADNGSADYELLENGLGRHHVTEENVTENPWGDEEGNNIFTDGINRTRDFIYGSYSPFARTPREGDPKAPDPIEIEQEGHDFWEHAAIAFGIHKWLDGN